MGDGRLLLTVLHVLVAWRIYPPNLKGVSSIKNTGGSVVQIDTGLLNEFVCASGYVDLFR